MKVRGLRVGFGISVVLILLCLRGTACASLLDKYEKGLDGAGAPARSQPKSEAPGTSRPPQPQVRESVAGDLQPGSIVIPPSYVKAMLKEHANFVECYTRADRNIRFYLLSGKRRVPPNAAQIRAMREKIDLDLRLLASSTRRYANNLRYAQLAWEKAPLEEKNLVTSVLSYLFATPAWAFPLDRDEVIGAPRMLKQFEDGLGLLEKNIFVAQRNIYGITPRPGWQRRPGLWEDFKTGPWEDFKSSYPAQVMATGAKFGAVAAGTIAGTVLIVSTMPISSAAGVFLLSTTIVGGGLAAVSAGADLVDAVKDDGSSVIDKNTRDIVDKAGLVFSVINIGVNVHEIANAGTKAEVILGVLSTVGETIDIWNAVEEEDRAQGNKEMEKLLKDTLDRNDGGRDGGGDGGGHGHH